MKKIDDHKLARMPLGKAAAFVAKETGCPKPALSTLIRWATKGVKGVRLDAERFGNRWYSRPASILDFHCRVNAAAGCESSVNPNASAATRAAVSAALGRTWGGESK